MEADIAVIVVNWTMFNDLKKRCIDAYIERQIHNSLRLWARFELPCIGVPVLVKKYQRGYKTFSKWMDMRAYLNGNK